MEFSRLYKGEKAVLLGNGFNLISSDISWGNILKNLKDSFRLEKIEINDSKSYPLIFEEILFSLKGDDFELNLKLLKENIATSCAVLKPNEFHERLIQSKVNEIITTNYDYSLERCTLPYFNGLKATNNRPPWKYSLSRYHNINNKRIWHIHGELNNGYLGKGTDRYPEQSIMIGNEHYADYFRKIHESLKDHQKKDLVERLINMEDNWTKLFFTHDIHIIGLNLSFSENHIWWLLNFRARLIKSGYSIQNKIHYHYAEFNKKASKNTLDILQALNVKCIPIEAPKDDYKKVYNEALDILRK